MSEASNLGSAESNLAYKKARRSMWHFIFLSVMLGIIVGGIYLMLSLQLWVILMTPAEYRGEYIAWLWGLYPLNEWLWVVGNTIFWTLTLVYCLHKVRSLRRVAKEVA